VLDLDEPVNILDMSSSDPSHFDCTLFKGYGLDGVTMDFFPSSIVEDEPYAIDETYLSFCYRFTILLMSMPSMSGGEHELDVDVEIDFEGGPSDGAHHRIIMLMDPELWKFFILKKDLNPESLMWFLLLQQFEFEVRDKG